MRLRSVPFVLAIVIVCLIAAPLVAVASPAQQTCGPNVTHVVAHGQNMFRIALAYGTTVSAIAQANQIANPNVIYAGQTLLIPCAGQTPGTPATPPPAATPLPNPYELDGLFVVRPPVVANPIALVGGEEVPLTADCRRLRASSPTDGFALGENTFYWDPAPGVTGYRINVYNLDRFNGRLVASYTVGPFFTNFRANLGEGYLGPGMLYAWEVQALVSDQPVCTSPRIRVYRSTTPS